MVALLRCMAILALAALAAEAASPKCARPRLRKEIRDLTDDEWDAFVSAMNTLKRNGRIDQYVAIHQQWTQPAHFGVLFLAWHRRFLWQFESEVLALTGNRLPGLPYFDPFMSYSVLDPSSPRFVGEGNGCIMTGAFRGWWSIEGRCVQRALGQTPPSFVDPRAMAALAMADAAFADYATTYENTQHADVHSTFGGQMATLQYSVNDVAFWLHHGHVDQVWYKRQFADVGRLYWDYSGIHTPGGVGQVSLNTRIPPWQDTVGAVADVYNVLCYDYADVRSAPPPQMLRKRDLGAGRPHDPHERFRIFNFSRTDPLHRCTPLPAERLEPLGLTVEGARRGCDKINALIDRMEADGRPVDEWPLPHEIPHVAADGGMSPVPRFALSARQAEDKEATSVAAAGGAPLALVLAIAALVVW